MLNAFELMKQMIEAGVAGVHFEDQLSSAKKCGHMGGKVLVPTQEAIHKLVAARLAADVCGVPTMLLARTDAEAAKLITSDVDERDRAFITSDKRTARGFFHTCAMGWTRRLRADLRMRRTPTCYGARPAHRTSRRRRTFADAIHKQFPGKMLAYNCSPSFNWKRKLDDDTIARFQRELGAMGYKFQFITLAGFHALNYSMFESGERLPRYSDVGLRGLQEAEFRAEKRGYTATRHQREVGAGYFDDVTQTIVAGTSSITALTGSTEEEQFHEAAH